MRVSAATFGGAAALTVTGLFTLAQGGVLTGGGSVTTVTGTYGYGNLEKDKFNVSVLATYQKTAPVDEWR